MSDPDIIGSTLGLSQLLTDGHADGRTNGRKTGSLYRAMPEAVATKMKVDYG